MTDEVSWSLRIGITVMLIAAFLSVVINVSLQSSKIMTMVENKAGDATSSVTSAQILQLAEHNQNYMTLYRAYANAGGLINSIAGEDVDGTKHLHYCINSNFVSEFSSVKSVVSSTSYQNYNKMESEYLRDFCKDSKLYLQLRVEVRKSKLDGFYDIYYKVLDMDY